MAPAKAAPTAAPAEVLRKSRREGTCGSFIARSWLGMCVGTAAGTAAKLIARLKKAWPPVRPRQTHSLFFDGARLGNFLPLAVALDRFLGDGVVGLPPLVLLGVGRLLHGGDDAEADH